MRRQRQPGDRGAVTIFLVVAVFALMLAIGLVVDAGAKIRATQRAEGLAEEMARAGGQAVLFGDDNCGTPCLDNGAAAQAALNYIGSVGDGVTGGILGTTETTLQVQVTVPYDTVFLSLIGIGSGSVTRDATARLAYGVTQEQ